MPLWTVAQLATECRGTAEGDESRLISGANSLDKATGSDVSFSEGPKSHPAALASRAGCLVVVPDFPGVGTQTLIRVNQPRAAFARIVALLYPARALKPGVHPTAVVHENVSLGEGCEIGPYVTLAAGSKIGAGSRIDAGTRVGENCAVGQECVLHPNVTLYPGVTLGDRVIVHAGTVLGADGFGYTLCGDHYEKFPQVGTVVIGNDVEIGANCCVDRAALGATQIGRGTKLDNLVHVGHNCTIGQHVVIAAQTGFSGGVTVGDYAAIGGQAGIGERAVIQSKAVVGGKAGVLVGQRVKAGEPVWGIPARPLRQHLKNLAHVSKLPATHEELTTLRKRVEILERGRTNSDS